MGFHHSRKRGGHGVSGVWGGATQKKRGMEAIKSWDLTELGVFDFEYTPKIAILIGCGSTPFV